MFSMSNISGDCVAFYIMGRRERRLPESPDFDEKDFHQKIVVEGRPFCDVVREACAEAVKHASTDRKRKRFLSDNEDHITSSGVGKDAAYEAYCAGLADELAYACNDDALETLESVALDDDDDDADGEDDESDGDDD